MKNIALAIGTILTWGAAAFFRKMSVDRIHPYQLQVIGGIVYAVEIPIWLWLIERNKDIGHYDSMGVVYGLACIAINVVGAVMFGMLLGSSSSPGATSTIVAIYPVVTALMSWAFLGEEYTVKKIVATIITLVGIILFTM